VNAEDALAEVHMVGMPAAQPLPSRRPDPAVLEGLKRAAEQTIAALPDPDPELPELAAPGSLLITVDFVELLKMVGEPRIWEMLAHVKEMTG
jgi:hypothetical protein